MPVDEKSCVANQEVVISIWFHHELKNDPLRIQ